MLNSLMFFPVPPAEPVDGRPYVKSGFLEPGNTDFSVAFAGPARTFSLGAAQRALGPAAAVDLHSDQEIFSG